MMSLKAMLLVDPNEEDIAATTEKLVASRVQFGELQVAHSLPEATQMLSATLFDLVLLELGITDSLRALMAVRRVYSGLLIVLTNIDSEAVGMDAIAMGADDYLVKSRVGERELRQSIGFAQQRRQTQSLVARISAKVEMLDVLLR